MDVATHICGSSCLLLGKHQSAQGYNIASTIGGSARPAESGHPDNYRAPPSWSDGPRSYAGNACNCCFYVSADVDLRGSLEVPTLLGNNDFIKPETARSCGTEKRTRWLQGLRSMSRWSSRAHKARRSHQRASNTAGEASRDGEGRRVSHEAQ